VLDQIVPTKSVTAYGFLDTLHCVPLMMPGKNNHPVTSMCLAVTIDVDVQYR
jgi:hypothetical protein